MAGRVVGRFGVAGVAAAGVLSAIAAPGISVASPPPPNPNATGTVIYIVNNTSQVLVFDTVDRFINIADRSDTVDPGETGWVKGTETYGAVSLTYVVGDPRNAVGSVYISVSKENGALLTQCTSSGNLECSVSQPALSNLPSQVTVANR